ncbi:pleiotropic drug resistance protein, partial [Trifolium medium]|nr:pleiotropic drug resistance protein [Trifolium medium]
GDTMVGNAMFKGISKGQRKHVTIGDIKERSGAILDTKRSSHKVNSLIWTNQKFLSAEMFPCHLVTAKEFADGFESINELQPFLLLVLVNQMATAFCRLVAAVSRDMAMAATLGMFSLGMLLVAVSKDNIRKWWL